MHRFCLAILAVLDTSGTAFAHAHLHASVPAAESTGPAPSELALNFSEGLETKFSIVEVTDAAGARVDTADLHAVGGDPSHVAVGLKPLQPGIYNVIWHATAVDTHKTEGHFIFTVATASAQGITIQRPWARATTPSQTVGGTFLSLTNTGAADSLVSASSPDADHVELHQTVDDNGVMKMLPIPALPLATGQTVELKPGSYHLMVMGLKHPLTQGTNFPLTLNFANAGPVTISVKVEAAGASGAVDHGTMNHGAMDHGTMQMAPTPMTPAKP